MSDLIDAGFTLRAPGRLLLGFSALALCALGLLGVAPAIAAIPGPHWSIVSQSEPTYFKPGDSADAFRLIVRNDGGMATRPGSPVTISDTLPLGVIATNITGRGEGPNRFGSPTYRLSCELNAVACTYEEGPRSGPVVAGAIFTVTITVSVAGDVEPPLGSTATVSGGGAPAASMSETTTLGASPVPFGLDYFTTDAADTNGAPDTQADSHPFELSTEFAFNIASRETVAPESPLSNASVKDLEVALPPGLTADPASLPQCTQQEFQEREGLNCPLDTQVGTVKPYFYGAFPSGIYPLFNIAPPPGQPAELGFTIGGIGHLPIFFHLRSEGDYGLTAQLRNLPSLGPLQGALLTLWGVPAARNHDLEREGTLGEGEEEDVCNPSVEVENGEEEQSPCPSGVAPQPFLTLPTSCTNSPLPVGVRLDSWQSPTPQEVSTPPLPGLTGCEELSFDPSISVHPEVSEADAPSGYTIDIHLPQNDDPSGLSTPDLKEAALTLPLGLVVSPSVADGLQGCSDIQFAQHSTVPASCPRASQIGTVRIATPLLSSPMEGQLFLGTPSCGPCGAADARQGRMLRLFLQAQGSGLTVKLAGSISVDQSTGQLTATFDEDPQLPFEELKLIINGGAGAPLANPSTCGVPLTATSRLTPYSAEEPAEPSSDPFEVEGCPSTQFNPSFVAGTTDNQAGTFSPETMTVSRTDQESELGAITLRNPPGLLANLSKVSLCPEAQAQSGTCPPQSQIGTATVAAGPGSLPFYLGGSVFFTGPYKGAPFGLAIVVPALVGPFELGVVVVRATVDFDPATAALTLRSDALPQALDGIPLQLTTIHLDLNREGFILNPTNCRRMSLDATVAAATGALASVSSLFQTVNCASLGFSPKLHMSLSGGSHRGAQPKLRIALSMPNGDADIKRAAISLPPTELVDTPRIQSPCSRLVFAEGSTLGERCPVGSVIGFARAVTPLLGKPLEGPVYLRSAPGRKLPDIVAALNGRVDIDLDGHVESVGGRLRASFATVPDAPVSKFTLSLDGGKKGLIINSANLCKTHPRTVAKVVGQNGKRTSQSVAVRTPCKR